MTMKTVVWGALVAAALAGCCSWCPCDGLKTDAVSPDGLNRIALVRTDGAVKITSYRRGVPTVTATFAGLDYMDGAKGPNPATDKITGSTFAETKGVRKTPVYKRAEISLADRRTTVSFERGWAIELAARNDGVAWRVVTNGKANGQVKIAAERTSFRFASDSCWVWPGYGRKGGKYDRFQWGFQPANEKQLARDMRVDDGSKAALQCLPLMSENPATGKWATITESNIRDYPSMQLVRPSAADATVSAIFAPYPAKTEYTGRYYRVLEREKFIARTVAARAFPWRVTLQGDTAGELTDSDCVAALAQGPDEGADFSWVKPGIVAWDWWNNWNLKGVGFKPGVDTRTYKYYIDFASRHGIPYVILDEGWSEKLDVTRVQKNIDLAELIRYGRERQNPVSIILWCAWAQLPGRQDEIFAKYAKMGVKGFKIDFMNRDDQEVVNFLEETARIAAKYRFHVDYHGMFKPYGLEQRYPNVLSYEGVHGLEELKWVTHKRMPLIDCQHYFLRMSAGPMDYTPGAMLNRTKAAWKANYGSPASQGTRCHQMALLPLYFSPLQMMADSPTNYEANEESATFMAGVPTAWDETRTLGGRPDAYAAVARRKGDCWWIGVIGDWEPREIELDLGFLGAGEWVAETFADAPDADVAPEHYVRRTDVKVGRTLKVRLAPGGGFAAKIRRR